MKIVDLIRSEMIVPRLAASDKRAVIEELAAHIARTSAAAGRPLDEALVSRVLADREQLASTAVGEGVAIPHGKLPGITDIVACLGRATAGVEFGALDGQKTYLFFVLIAPEASTGTHLKALARISRVFRDADFRRRLLEADAAATMYDVLADEDAKY
jgi:PTS system nitrogen regulatory IIA component